MKWLQTLLHLKIFEIILTMSFMIFSQRQIAWQKGLVKLHLQNAAWLVDRSQELTLFQTHQKIIGERSNSALRYIKNTYKNSMSDPHLNALILMYVHRYMNLDYNKNRVFATKHPRRMLLILPEETEWIVHQQLLSCRFKKIVAKNSPDETWLVVLSDETLF